MFSALMITISWSDGKRRKLYMPWAWKIFQLYANQKGLYWSCSLYLIESYWYIGNGNATIDKFEKRTKLKRTEPVFDHQILFRTQFTARFRWYFQNPDSIFLSSEDTTRRLKGNLSDDMKSIWGRWKEWNYAHLAVH